MKVWKWKKLGILLLCIFCYGCGNQENPEKSISLTVWNYYSGKQKEAFDDLVSSFNDTVGMEKGIVVSSESKGDVTELITAITDSVDGKVGSAALPDIFSTYVDTAYALFQEGLLVDIGQYMTDEEQDAYVPAFFKEGELSPGEFYILPVAKSTELLYLNKTDWELFASDTGAGLEELSTWEGLAHVAEQYYFWSGGKAFFGRDVFANYPLIGSRQLGKEIFQVTGGEVTVQLDEAVMARLWEYYAVPYIKGYYGSYGRFRSDDVKTGDLVACVASTTSIFYYPDEITKEDGTTYPIEMMACPLPNFEGTDAYCVQQGAGMSVIKSDAGKEQAAVEFLKWFTDIEQNLDFCVSAAYMPVKSEANTSSQMEAALERAGVSEPFIHDNAMMYVETIKNMEFYTAPPFPQGNAFRNILTEYMTGKLDIYKEQIQDLGEDEVDNALEGYFQQWLSGLKAEFNP